jgi:hypothetical protein
MNTATAKEIQQELLSSQEALIHEANTILKNAEDNVTHAKSLAILGFSGSAAVLEKRMAEAKAMADLVDMYSFEYPGLKFIPAAAMANVCQKYGLAIGHVSYYIGEVPPWALAQIAANKRHIKTKNVFNEQQYRDAMEVEMKKRTEAGQSGVLFSQSGNSCHHYGENGGGVSGWMGYRFPQPGEEVFDREHGMQTVPDLDIAAPMRDMSIHKNEEVVDGQIVRKPIPMSLNPIVCIPVKGGYIVLAAWGEEGQDPQVFNATSN